MTMTGERFVPQLEGTIRLEHLHRYYLACELTEDKVVLDIACGEGVWISNSEPSGASRNWCRR